MPTHDTLPEHVRKWLSSISEDDAKDYREALRMYRALNTVGWFTKWLTLSVIAVFTGAVALGQAIGQFVGWFKGFGR